MNIELVSPPAQRVLTLDEVKAHLRVQHNAEDELIASLMLAAEQYLDGRNGILGRALVEQQYRLYLNGWPSDVHKWRSGFQKNNLCKLPFPPLRSVDEIRYIDEAGDEQLLDPAVYSVAHFNYIGVVALSGGQQWPATGIDDSPVRILFTAGYGPSGTDVPRPIRQAMLLMIGHWYQNRSSVDPCDMSEVPLSSQALLQPYQVNGLHAPGEVA